MAILQPDICIIGAGSGGLTVAAAASALGASVVLIERGKMGGDCLNTGCVPSKALIAASKRAHTIRHAEVFGVSTDELNINFERIHEHVHGVIGAIAPHDSVERFEAMGVKVIKASAQFVDKNTIEAGEDTIRAHRFVIATGSRPAIPPIPGLDEVDYLTNATIFEQTRKRAHLVIIGGGPIGMELAQAHCRLGCKVTVVEMFEPLAKDDPELTAIALRKLQAEGINILANTAVKQVAPNGQGVVVTVERDGESQEIMGTHLLVAAGRAFNTEGLGLEKAGIDIENRSIKVNGAMRTTNRRTYAIGDVSGGFQFTHAAGYQAGLVVRNALFGMPVSQNTSLIPWATYTDPEIAQVGLTEQTAREKRGDNFRVIRVSYADNNRAQAERRTEGLLKVIVDHKGRILGAGIVGLNAGELISFFSYAMANKLKVSSLTKFIAPYPTLTEIVKSVGVEFYRDQINNPWLARLRRLVRMLP